MLSLDPDAASTSNCVAPDFRRSTPGNAKMSQAKKKLLGLFRRSTISEGSVDKVERRVSLEQKSTSSSHRLNTDRRRAEIKTRIGIERGIGTKIEIEIGIVNVNIAEQDPNVSAVQQNTIHLGADLAKLNTIAQTPPKRDQNPGVHPV